MNDVDNGGSYACVEIGRIEESVRPFKFCKYETSLKKQSLKKRERSTWVAQMVKPLTSALVMIFQSVSLSPMLGSEPEACLRFCVFFSLCPSLTRALSLCLSKMNTC